MSTHTNESNIIRPKIFSADPTVCPECKGAGYILQWMSTPDSKAIYGNDTEVEVAVKCPSCNGGYALKVESAKRTADIPQAFYDSRYEAFDWAIYPEDLRKQKSFVESFINDYEKWEQKGLGLYIWSKTRGSGKTFLASCICNELMQKYAMKTKFVSATELLDIAKSADKSAPDEYKQDPIKLLCNCKMLVIDDLGQKNSGTQWMSDILFRIFDDRMNKKLVTVVTSNIKMENLDMDDRIVDRLNKLCQAIPLPDYCVRAKESNKAKMDFYRELGLVESEKESNQRNA